MIILRKAIEGLKPMNSGIAKKDFEIKVEHPKVPMCHHKINALKNLLTKLNVFQINPNIGKFLGLPFHNNKGQLMFFAPSKYPNSTLKNIDG